jgi:cytoskeletal protein CcmA (bactofilin family)
MDNVANIGKSLQIKGELTGNEDLTVEGRVDGKIFLKDHKLTIGPNGRVKADLQAKSVIVSGKLDGNVTADDRVEITATGSMTGDVTAPRVVLADGARFKGSVDMEGKSGASSASVGASVSEIPRKTASAKA